MNLKLLALSLTALLCLQFAGAGEIRTTPLVLKVGGTPEQPAIFDGKGMVIDLGMDVSEHDWRKEGDIWTSRGPFAGQTKIGAGQLAGMFIEEVPIAIPRDTEAEKLHPDRKQFCYLPPEKLKPGQMGFADDGSIYFRWPTGKIAGKARVLLPPKQGTSCVVIACSNIVVRNLTARHAANDGFNIHGRWTGIRLENVKAFSNGDEGISAHDDVQMEVVGAEVAWNGSVAGGIADVNRCVTSYRDCKVHDNLGAAFFFSGKSHRVTNCTIFNQSKDFVVSGDSHVSREQNEWRRPQENKP